MGEKCEGRGRCMGDLVTHGLGNVSAHWYRYTYARNK